MKTLFLDMSNLFWPKINNSKKFPSRKLLLLKIKFNTTELTLL